MNRKLNDLKAVLKNNLDMLIQSGETLSMSWKKCCTIELTDQMTFEETESFDSLTSKFARSADLLTQKVLRTVLILHGERPDSFLDKIYFAEKLKIISSADRVIEIRDLRNTIAHEYVNERLIELYVYVLAKTEGLISEINHLVKYCHKKFDV
jgi:hypothetical protein